MDARLRRDLLRPKRWAVALAVALALGGLGGGLIAFVSAGASSSDAVAFQAVGPRIGDAVRYAASGGGTFGYDWLEDGVVHDAAGVAHGTHMLLVNDSRDRSGGVWLLGLSSDGHEVAAYAVDASRDGTPGANGADRGSGAAATPQRHTLEQRFDDRQGAAERPCGLAPQLWQARHVPGDKLPLAPCRPSLVGDLAGAQGWLILDRTWSDGTVRFALAHEESDAGAVRYGYRSDVPYAVLIEGSNGDRLTLAGFSPGSTPLPATLPALPTQPAAPLETAPSQPWGPSEAGIQHPFPLAAAWQRTRDDASFTTLRDFQAGHPGTYVAAASYSELLDPEDRETWRTWTFTATDGHDEQEFTARAVERPQVYLPDGLGPTSTSYDFSAGRLASALGDRPLRAPTTMPTVASLWSAWQVFASPRHASEAPNAWSFDLRCDDACTTVQQEYAGGLDRYDRTVVYPEPTHTLPPSDPVDTRSRSILTYDATGNATAAFPASATPTAYTEDRIDWTRGDQSPAVAPGFPEPSGAAHALAWGAFPTAPAVAAAGIGALLAALAYALWPALKAGPATLFTRLRADDLLQNPLRAELHALIEAQPGIHHRALARATGRAKGAVEHHLRKLVQGGLVSAVRASGHTCYFVGQPQPADAAAAPVLKSPVAQAILAGVQATPGVRAADLARSLRVAPTTVQYHVARLRSARLLAGSPRDGGLHAA